MIAPGCARQRILIKSTRQAQFEQSECIVLSLAAGDNRTARGLTLGNERERPRQCLHTSVEESKELAPEYKSVEDGLRILTRLCGLHLHTPSGLRGRPLGSIAFQLPQSIYQARL